jgi:hypothetical protein
MKSLRDLLNPEEEQLYTPMRDELESIPPTTPEPVISDNTPQEQVFTTPKLEDVLPKKEMSGMDQQDEEVAPLLAETTPERPLSRQEQLLQEYLSLSKTDDLKKARETDRMLKMGGAIGDALATMINARSQTKAKIPGVQVQQGAGLGKVADLFQTAPEISSDLAAKREALLNQYKQLALGERSKTRMESEEKRAKERNETMLKAAGIKSAGIESSRDFREKVYEENKIKNLQDSFNKDKQVVKAEERIQSASTLRDMVDGNPITQEAAKTFAARASGEVGALSDQDRAAYGGSKAIIDRINSTATRAISGELTEKDKQFMKELADKFEAAGQRDLQARLSIYAKQGTKRTKMNEDEIKEVIRPDLSMPQIQTNKENLENNNTIIRLDPKTNRKVEYDSVTKKPIRFVD